MTDLTAIDSQFLALEDGRQHGHYSSVLTFVSDGPDEAVSRADLVERVRARLQRVAPFSWHLRRRPLRHPAWRSAPPDVDAHVGEVRLADDSSHDDVLRAAGDIVARPMDRHRPMWRLDLLQHGAGRTTLVTRFHHAASDGIAGAAQLAALFDEGELLPGGHATTQDDPGQPLEAQGGLRGLVGNLDQVTMTRVLPGVQWLAAAVRDGGRPGPGATMHVPRSPFAAVIDSDRVLAHAALPLSEVRAIGGVHRATVNDVITATVAGGLRRFLEKVEGAPPDVPHAAFVPVSVRGAGETGAFGNRIASLVPPLHVEIDDPVDRLRATRRTMVRAKARLRRMPPTMLSDTVGAIPPPLLGVAARGAMLAAARFGRYAPATCTLSNVPGPPTPVHLCGARLERAVPASAIFHGMGLNVTAFSYAGTVEVGLVTSPACTDDLAVLAAAIESEHERLLAASEA